MFPIILYWARHYVPHIQAKARQYPWLASNHARLVEYISASRLTLLHMHSSVIHLGPETTCISTYICSFSSCGVHVVTFCLPGSSTGILMHPIPQPSTCYFPCFSCISARISKHLGTQQQDSRLPEKHWWIQRFISKQINETLHHVVQRWSGWAPILDV